MPVVDEPKDWSRATVSGLQLTRRLQDPSDQAAWFEVDGRYGPLIQAHAVRRGLRADLALDARQEAMCALAKAVQAGRFPSDKSEHGEKPGSRTRAYLFRVAQYVTIKIIRGENKIPLCASSGPDEPSILETLPGEDEWERRWNEEWELAVRQQCLREAQAHFTADTYRVFYLKTVEERSAAEIAAMTGKTEEAVHTATSRVRSFLRRIFPEMTEIF